MKMKKECLVVASCLLSVAECAPLPKSPRYQDLGYVITNRVVASPSRQLSMAWVRHAENNLGASRTEVVNLLTSYIRQHYHAPLGTTETILCHNAIWALSQLASDEQLTVLADVATSETNYLSRVAFRQYLIRRHNSDGFLLADKILSDETQGIRRHGKVWSGVEDLGRECGTNSLVCAKIESFMRKHIDKGANKEWLFGILDRIQKERRNNLDEGKVRTISNVKERY